MPWQASARTGGQERLDIVLVTAESGRKKMTDARPHLDGRSLSAESEPGAHRQHAAKEFHGDQNQRRRRLLVTQHRLDVRDAASLCSWRDFRTSQAANPVAMAEIPMTSAKPAISLPCAQSMTAPRKRSDRSRTSRKTAPTRPDVPPTANAKSARTSRLPCSRSGLGRQSGS